MSQDRPFALLITWTCHGTWLPGDERGHVSDILLPEGGFVPKQNTPGTPYRGGDSHTHAHARKLQKDTTVLLTAELAQVAAVALIDASAKCGWRILRAALMRNHVHVVISDCPPDGEAVRRILKGNSQAALSDHAGRNRRWWTQGGSDRYKNDEEAIQAAVQYVANQSGKLVEIVDTEVRQCVEVTHARRGLSPPGSDGQ